MTRGRRIGIAAMWALAAFAAWRMQLFAPWRAFGTFDTFGSFDHPFHLARAETLVRSLLHGRSLRWIANHQGGYPAEFYPFGWAWVEAALWFAGLGRVPLPIVHRAATVGLFLLPGAMFAWMAARDRWPITVPLSAFALHVAVPGEMWSGGYSELVYVGLAPSVAAAIAAVASMTAASAAFASGSRRACAVSAAAAAAAIWCNPRTVVALVVCVGAAWVVSVRPADWRRPTIQLLTIAGIASLLAVPELLSLARFGRLYYFIRYTGYDSSLDYLAVSIETVSLPGFVLAGVGAAAAFRLRHERTISYAAAAALVAYAAATLLLSFGMPSAIEQLETTRLMPVQRLLMIYLAAVGLHALAAAAIARWQVRRLGPPAVEAVAVAALLTIYVGPERLMPFWSRGLFPVHRTGTPAFGFLHQVLKLADEAAPTGTAILIAGTPNDDRPQLWAPVDVDRPLFYDDWMWYWHTRHRGPYDPTRTSRYDLARVAEILDREYLQRNGIGAVVAAPSVQLAADAAPALKREFGGTYGLYVVRDPVRIVTLGSRSASGQTIENERIVADGTSDGDYALIRRNWFPRWRVAVNGRPASIIETDDGYMRVPVPRGRVHLELVYALEPLDSLARLLMAIGVVAAAGLGSVGDTRRDPAEPLDGGQQVTRREEQSPDRRAQLALRASSMPEPPRT